MDIETLKQKMDEVSVGYARAFGIERSEDWALLKLVEELGELTRAHLKCSGQGRVSAEERASLRENFEDELADVLGQVLVLAALSGVDLARAIDRKWLKWHPDRRHP